MPIMCDRERIPSGYKWVMAYIVAWKWVMENESGMIKAKTMVEIRENLK